MTLTNMTLDLYNSIIEKLPPTPSRFHYIFNLRDLSRIYEGLTQITEEKFSSLESIVRLWRNESLRIFHDRLISQGDKDIVNAKIKELLEENFSNIAEPVLSDPIIFGDYKNTLVEDAPRLYEDLGSFDTVI